MNIYITKETILNPITAWALEVQHSSDPVWLPVRLCLCLWMDWLHTLIQSLHTAVYCGHVFSLSSLLCAPTHVSHFLWFCLWGFLNIEQKGASGSPQTEDRVFALTVDEELYMGKKWLLLLPVFTQQLICPFQSVEVEIFPLPATFSNTSLGRWA